MIYIGMIIYIIQPWKIQIKFGKLKFLDEWISVTASNLGVKLFIQYIFRHISYTIISKLVNILHFFNVAIIYITGIISFLQTREWWKIHDNYPISYVATVSPADEETRCAEVFVNPHAAVVRTSHASRSTSDMNAHLRASFVIACAHEDDSDESSSTPAERPSESTKCVKQWPHSVVAGGSRLK
jgi:hypothetical protein